MATADTLQTKPASATDSAIGTVSPSELVGGIAQSLASLKLTVSLFALSIILVLAGTLAQIDHDIWYVVHNYFRSTVAWIDLQVFFPRAWGVGGTLPFPGGWTLGAMLGVNLLAAHLLRFKVVAHGRQLIGGACLTALGVLLTYLVIQSGIGNSVKGELSPEFCNGLWHALRASLGGAALLWAYRLSLRVSEPVKRSLGWHWWLAAISCGLLLTLAIWLFLNPAQRLDPAGLRILWQLIKGTAAAGVLLWGCHLLFARRAGIVLLHGGIALMMFSELHTGMFAEEARMMINEGQTVSYAEDIRSAELAIVDKSDVQQDRVVTVPLSLLVEAYESGTLLELPDLPFGIRVKEYFPNAVTRLAHPAEKPTADSGWGAMRVVESRAPSTGASTEQAVDLPAAILEIVPSAAQSLGTYLTWSMPSSNALTDAIEVEEAVYELSLRFKRIPKPYSVSLIDFKFDKWPGTNIPKNFSSEVQLTDESQNVDRVQKIWMNNPLRYRGDTLYQADWDKETERGTVLQVVTNTGWMVPYVSCVIVGAGMFYHFGLTFWRFTNNKTLSQQQMNADAAFDWRSRQTAIPALLVLLFAGWIFSKTRTPETPLGDPNLQEFATLPLAYEGRIQPFDTLARNALTVVSGKGEVELESGEKLPAVQWFLDMVTSSPASADYRVFRIESLDVLDTLDLDRRPGFRYSASELADKGAEIMRQARLAIDVPEEQRTLAQAKFLELSNRMSFYITLRNSFAPPSIRTDSRENLMADLSQTVQEIRRLENQVPQPVPPSEPGGDWRMMTEAEVEQIFASIQNKPTDEATKLLRDMFVAYRAKEAGNFNSTLADYKELVAERSAADEKYQASLDEQPEALSRKTAEQLDIDRVAYEAWFNQFNPFVLAMSLYLVCFLLSAGSWLGWNTILNRSANWLLWLTFALHTYALLGRIYISGRPPVTNLYSSAVFIGWAAVLFALIAEWIYRRGLGNLLAAVIGFPTLFIAYNLAGEGDTFKVLQAVLDTQFWLATHVVCITLGYAATFLAGFMGILFVVLGLGLRRLDQENSKQLIRMTYGTLCFAIFFSFIGTVLGGLWADDSWGRFWGWDPKENGALIIVLWNALVLHARWGGMVTARGLAVLSIFGNVVTAWSWFGVNLMGVGLHSYGFTDGRDKWLLSFVLSQLAIMAIGVLAKPDVSPETDQKIAHESAG